MRIFYMSIKITDSITNIPQEILVCRQSHHGGHTFIVLIKLIYIGGVPEFF